MSKRGRMLAFAGAAAIALAAVALNTAGERGRGAAAGEPATPPLPPATVVRAARNRPEWGTVRARSARRTTARRQAVRFLRAFRRYQTGDGSVGDSPLGEMTAAVRRRLSESPPHGRPPGSRVVWLRLYPRRADELKASALLDYGRGAPSLFEFLLRRGRRGWRVTELYP
jgi:hypothetical protein